MKNFRKGFTLLEILLVVGIIAILAGIVIVAINPSKQLAQVRNTERKSDLKQLNSAITQFYIDHSYYPASTTDYTSLTEICDTDTATSSDTCGSLVNLTELVPTYITAIPKDPLGPVTAFLNKIINTVYAATGGTGYYVMKDSNKIILNTERAELGVVIAIGTTTGMVSVPVVVDTCEATNPDCWSISTTIDQWGTMGVITGLNENTSANNNGKANTATLIQRISDYSESYPAASYCYNLTEGGVIPGTWFLPANQQLVDAYNAGVTGFTYSDGTEYYWSSTEYSVYPDLGAWEVGMVSNGDLLANPKDNGGYKIRCLR